MMTSRRIVGFLMTSGSSESATPVTPATLAPSPIAFHYKNYLLLWLGRLFSSFAVQIVVVAVGWHIYDLTRDPFNLGLIGLIQFLPSAVLVLVTGAVADRVDRRKILAICLAIEAIGAAILLMLVLDGSTEIWPIYATLLLFGIGRAFFAPAAPALVPSLVPPQALANAITWASSAWQLATIVGPVVGGLLYGVSPEVAYTTAFVLLFLSTILVCFISVAHKPRPSEKAGWANVLAGLHYIRREKVVLGAISLDLFAVILGGATALLPAVARDVLDVGPWGLGLLRAGPGIGAIAMATLLSVFPIKDHAGRLMFACVALFGIGTIAFGLSTVVWVSIVALIIMGAADMVSVVVRETLLQLWTPDAMRGRVYAVNMVFVGASNELGEFRAGISASLIGVMPAIIFGGVGTVVVAALWAFWFPELREARKLDAPKA